MELLISKEDFSGYYPFIGSIDSKVLESNILEIQRKELPRSLGDNLCSKLISFTSDYENLLKGCSYINSRGDEVIYHGLHPVIVYFTLAQLFLQKNIVLSENGFCFLSERVHEKSLLSAIDMSYFRAKNTALRYEQEAVSYLLEHRESYPEWTMPLRERVLSGWY